MKRDLKNFNEREFLETIYILDWDYISNLKNNDPDVSCKNFCNGINYLLDESAPYKKVTKNDIKLMTKPWISNDILKKCKDRDSFLKKIAKEKDPVNKINLCNEYKKLRNELIKVKRDSKKAYYAIYFEKNKKNILKFGKV